MAIKLISARKSYEFAVDGIRLSAISTPGTLGAIRDQFQFQTVQIATPMETFGRVPAVLPPGVVFNVGVWSDANLGMMLIRFLHIEQTRIVVDIAGPSEALDSLGQALFQTIRETARVFDDGPVLDEPKAGLHYSEMTVQLPAPLSVLLPLPFRNLFSSSELDRADRVLSTALLLDHCVQDTPYEGDRWASPIRSEGYRLSLRQGINPQENVYFSGAPLDTRAHQDYLGKLYDIVEQQLNSMKP